MKTLSKNSEWTYHTWRDIGGATGLFLDSIFCGLVIVAAFFMILLGGGLLAIDYIAKSVHDMISWVKPSAST